MSDSEKPTDPNIIITKEDLFSYIVGAVQRIEAQLASDEAPKWAMQLFERLQNLETEVQNIKRNCSARHQSNGQKFPII